MGADRTLVDAAFKEAATKYGGDVINMKPMYDSNVAGANKVFKTITGAMDVYAAKKEVGRAGVRKQLEGFQTQVNAGVKDMYAQDEPMHDAFINAFRDKIMSLQDEFEDVNTYGKGDNQENSQARTRIEGELKRVISQANQFRGKTEVFFDNLENVDPGGVYGPSVAAHQQALNFKDYDRLLDEGKIEVKYGKDGIEITSRKYDTRTTRVPLTNPSEQFLEAGSDNMMDQEESYGEDVIVTLASLNENFRPTDIEHHTGIMKNVNNYTKSGELEGKKAKVAYDANGEMVEFNWNEDEAISNFTRQVNSKENFDNVVSSSIEGLYEVETSFKASLEKNIDISVGVLQNMFVDDDNDGINDLEEVFNKLDVAGGADGGDGVIDEKDLAAGAEIPGFERNLDAIIDALTNTSNPAFNMKTSAPMLGAFLAEAAKGRSELAFNITAGSRKSDGSGTTGSQIIYGGANLGEKSFVVQDSILDKAMNGEPIISWGNDRFDPDPNNPGNYIQEGTTTSILIDNLLRGKHFGMNERINSRKLEYPTGLPNVLGDPPASSVETPNSEAFKWNLPRAGRIEVVENWKVEFPDFKFDNPGTMKQTVTITAPNKKTLTIKLGSSGGDKVKEAKVFNEFMEKNKKNPEKLKGLSQEEIKESVAKGEESKFNVGPNGELLSEGYTMNDLGKVVWVGGDQYVRDLNMEHEFGELGIDVYSLLKNNNVRLDLNDDLSPSQIMNN